MTDDEGFKRLLEYVSLSGDALKKVQEFQKNNFVPEKLDVIEEEEEEDEDSSKILNKDFKFNTTKIETLYYTYIAMTLSKGIDILIMLDLTGSMASSIQMAKETIYKIVSFTKEKY